MVIELMAITFIRFDGCGARSGRLWRRRSSAAWDRVRVGDLIGEVWVGRVRSRRRASPLVVRSDGSCRGRRPSTISARACRIDGEISQPSQRIDDSVVRQQYLWQAVARSLIWRLAE